jgi:hypothetical protein
MNASLWRTSENVFLWHAENSSDITKAVSSQSIDRVVRHSWFEMLLNEDINHNCREQCLRVVNWSVRRWICICMSMNDLSMQLKTRLYTRVLLSSSKRKDLLSSSQSSLDQVRNPWSRDSFLSQKEDSVGMTSWWIEISLRDSEQVEIVLTEILLTEIVLTEIEKSNTISWIVVVSWTCWDEIFSRWICENEIFSAWTCEYEIFSE